MWRADDELSPTAYEAVFSPLAQGGRSQVVARRLEAAINLGHLPRGARLPSEAELAAQFAVSTITLREALATLRSQGLVETRRGRGAGTFVRGPRSTRTERVELLVRDLAVDELRDLGDHCAAIRGAAAKLAAARAGEDDMARLRELLANLAEAGPAAAAAWRRADGRLHVELASAAHSPRLARAELELQHQAADLLLLSTHDEPFREAALSRYRALLGAVEAAEAERARELAEEHVSAIVDRLIRVHLEVAAR
ncbi:GntR family transcriptional regulator [Conexibacter sp. JD483]|uniref:FadR/GntR family transcriptional regulator n=1 Tax=unclassified Conexibacter TaxID=2627773 RepID=UPI00271C64E2|nr:MULTISPECIES: GntR family transcriptional regulator [unclassified Conexibacter]MDO8187754.1 GntR family transcriptional regulator [Conexibacter sp. CPCC 205706]MDO8201363.1 GntR family transcriptional regulator [Conexibacter sp. CPCC 205762]MDR9372767.1 GntR family transcriptional regulator [Conexibacter sp. JD483]